MPFCLFSFYPFAVLLRFCFHSVFALFRPAPLFSVFSHFSALSFSRPNFGRVFLSSLNGFPPAFPHFSFPDFLLWPCSFSCLTSSFRLPSLVLLDRPFSCRPALPALLAASCFSLWRRFLSVFPPSPIPLLPVSLSPVLFPALLLPGSLPKHVCPFFPGLFPVRALLFSCPFFLRFGFFRLSPTCGIPIFQKFSSDEKTPPRRKFPRGGIKIPQFPNNKVLWDIQFIV